MDGAGALGNAEVAYEDRSAPKVGVPEEFRHLDERERVQGLNLRKLFAEQEHGLRQRYADWIL